MMRHELYDFFKRANEDIEREYERISWRVTEDPGTAGDQGEENWKKLLKLWIPTNFKVITKGRIIDDKGNASPQLDVIILAPDYPQQMLDCKLYLAGGVVAAFECKTTLRKAHINKFMENSKLISALALKDTGTPRKDLQSKIYYGLLAHSHEWKRPHSKPKENIRKTIEKSCQSIIRHPIEVPNIVCVADVATWHSCKLIIPPQPDVEMYQKLSVTSSFIEPKMRITGAENEDMEGENYTPVGALIFNLLEHLAWSYPSLRNIITYMSHLNLVGNGQGKMLVYPGCPLSEETLRNLCKLENGGLWNEWKMYIK